jgi:multidrug resistance efflux pump
VQKANALVAAAAAQIDQAAAVIESFKLKAQVAGTVEQITVAEGMTVGQATRTPLMYLIPSGPRVVRAEVEAEFAHKIDAFIGKTVTIRAGHNFNDTYTGVARRVNGAFLPKRFGGDSLAQPASRALECTIDVTDPAPPGRPPLRPGQPVRVEFGN